MGAREKGQDISLKHSTILVAHSYFPSDFPCLLNIYYT